MGSVRRFRGIRSARKSFVTFSLKLHPKFRNSDSLYRGSGLPLARAHLYSMNIDERDEMHANICIQPTDGVARGGRGSGRGIVVNGEHIVLHLVSRVQRRQRQKYL